MPTDDSWSTKAVSPESTPADKAPFPLGPVSAGMEVVPGYTLVTLLGRGGFGEVWRAVAPGGVPVALKFLRSDEASAAIEARALDFMKHIVHPHLITTFGIWHRADLLIIGMELADETLLARLRRAISEGHPGIPADELLEYLREAAKAIDFLNEPRHVVDGVKGVRITHRDIKPQNMLLAGGGVKVADFGLARVAERSSTSKSGGLTPAYAAPEFFEGQTHPQSDQYSLAVSYCQLRCARLPFEGHPFQVMAGHLQGKPDLSFLSVGEREVVGRAMSRHPDDRWPSNRVFVQRLAESGRSGAEASPSEDEAWIDTAPMLGPGGGEKSVYCDPSMPVWVFVDDVYSLINSQVEPYCYGKTWVLRDPATGRVFDVGSSWARSNQKIRDDRALRAVGIRPGMRLQVVPLRG